jgi:hypothetical protein
LVILSLVKVEKSQAFERGLVHALPVKAKMSHEQEGDFGYPSRGTLVFLAPVMHQ